VPRLPILVVLTMIVPPNLDKFSEIQTFIRFYYEGINVSNLCRCRGWYILAAQMIFPPDVWHTGGAQN
jgi:hypothetical protein